MDKEEDFEFSMVEIDLNNDEFLDYVLIEMAKKGLAIDKEAIVALLEVVDEYILTKIEGE